MTVPVQQEVTCMPHHYSTRSTVIAQESNDSKILWTWVFLFQGVICTWFCLAQIPQKPMAISCKEPLSYPYPAGTVQQHTERTAVANLLRDTSDPLRLGVWWYADLQTEAILAGVRFTKLSSPPGSPFWATYFFHPPTHFFHPPLFFWPPTHFSDFVRTVENQKFLPEGERIQPTGGARS